MAGLARLWIALIELTARWPQRARTFVAEPLGAALWWLIPARRRITLINLRLCFPRWSERERRRIGRRLAANIVRAVIDHSVLIRRPQAAVERYVRIEGLEHLQGVHATRTPLILIAPHFVGLDAGGIRVNTQVRGVSVYSKQNNRVWDAWVMRGRRRFADPVLIARQEADIRLLIRSVKDGLPLYYLPDADLGPRNSIFVPFFGITAATIPMASRLARMTGAKVMMAVTEMTADGYVLHFEPPWPDFPGASIDEDTARMNREIERWILRLPDQYLWTHKRFKTRPPGEGSVYASNAR